MHSHVAANLTRVRIKCSNKMMKLELSHDKSVLCLFGLLLIICEEVASCCLLQARDYKRLVLGGWQDGKVPQVQMVEEEVACQGIIAAWSERMHFMSCTEISDIVVNVDHYDLQVNG